MTASGRSRTSQHDPAEVILETISRLIRERHRMPDESASHEQVRAWVEGTLGTTWLGEIGKIFQDVKDILTDVETAIPNTLTEIEGKVDGVAGDVETELQKYFFPNVLAKTLVEDVKTAFGGAWDNEIEPELEKGFEKVIDYVTAVGQVAATFEYYLRRFGYAEHSLKDLAEIVDKNAPSQALFDAMKKLISAKNATAASDALLELTFMLIVEASPVLRLADTVLDVIKSGVWSNVFPYALAPGDLNAWINPDPSKDPISDEERQFRLEMVAAINHYCHSKFGGGDGKATLRAADDRLAIELIADISSVVLSTIFGYVMRRPSLPSLTLPKREWAFPFNHARRADDAGSSMSLTFSRQVAYPLKAGVGLVLRGFWDVSTLNNSLVEGVTSLISSSVSSLLESFLHDFLWSVEIHETYVLPDLKKDGDFVWGWPTTEPVYQEPNAETQEYLSYGVWVRKSVVSGEEASGLKALIQKNEDASELLQKLLKDYGAYMQSMRDYTDDQAVPGVITDAVELTSTKSPLTAQSTYPGDFPSVPVLRAYCGGKYVVMQNTGISSGKAQYACTLGDTPEGAPIYVRSNYGGSSQFPKK